MSYAHALLVHGVGQQPASFSDHAQRQLATSLAGRGLVLYGQPVHWAPVLDKPEATMMRAVKARGSKMNMTQRLVVGTLADALCFRNRQDELHAVFDVAEARLRANRLVICAHSLGVVLALNWLRVRPTVRVDRFITFGTNLELFNLGAQGLFDCPPQLRAPGVWVNHFYDADMLGWPIRGWIPQAADVEVPRPWSWTRFVPGLSHTSYWGDKSFWRGPVAQAILGA